MTDKKIWSRFVATRKSDGTKYKFYVQEGAADEKEAVMEFMAKYMSPYESFSKASGMFKNRDAVKEMKNLCGQFYDDSHIMICYEENEQKNKEIVGLSMVALDGGDEADKIPEIISKLTTPEAKKLFGIIHIVEDLYSVKKNLGIDRYYSGRGVCIQPKYAGLGIASEMLKLRRELCKEQGVPATAAWMTAFGSQIAAERDGWKTAFEIPFDDLAKLCDCEFLETPPTLKLMIAYADNKSLVSYLGEFILTLSPLGPLVPPSCTTCTTEKLWWLVRHLHVPVVHTTELLI